MTISVFLADDNLIVREGVKALLELEDDFDIVGQGADYQELVDGAEAANPQVIVTDIRMPPNFTREGLTNPVRVDGSLSAAEEKLLQHIAEGRSIGAIAAHLKSTTTDCNRAVEALFAKLAEGTAAGRSDSLDRLKMLQRAIVDRKEQGEALERLLPGGVAAQIMKEGRRPGETEELTVTVLMSDIRGYTTIAEHADPSILAGQLHAHRAAMNRAILDEGGTVMQFVGDAVMAVFGAPVAQADHAERGVAAAQAMHLAQDELNDRWVRRRRRRSDLAWGCRPGWWQRPFLVRRNGSSTHLWETPSISPSDSSSGPTLVRPCSANRRGRRSRQSPTPTN